MFYLDLRQEQCRFLHQWFIQLSHSTVVVPRRHVRFIFGTRVDLNYEKLDVSPLRTKLDCHWPRRTTSNHFGLLRTTSDHLGLLQTTSTNLVVGWVKNVSGGDGAFQSSPDESTNKNIWKKRVCSKRKAYHSKRFHFLNKSIKKLRERKRRLKSAVQMVLWKWRIKKSRNFIAMKLIYRHSLHCLFVQ